MSDMEQDDIDKLLADALGNSVEDETEADDNTSGSESDVGPRDQDDIDALLANIAIDDASDESSGTAIEDIPDDSTSLKDNGPESQDDIDNLLAGMIGSDAPVEEPPVEPDPAPEPKVANQDDIDALLGNIGYEQPDADVDELAAMLDGIAEEASESKEKRKSDTLITQAAPDIAAEMLDAAPVEKEEPSGEQISLLESEDDDSALRELITEAADEADEVDEQPAPEPEPPEEPEEAEIPEALIVEHEIEAEEREPESKVPSEALTDIAEKTAAPPEVEELTLDALEVSEPTPPPMKELPPLEDMTAIRESLSLITGAGEVEGIAGQIASLLGQLSEKARRYQSAWMGSDHETKELRTRLIREEHQLTMATSDRKAALEEASELRKRLDKHEGERLAAEEVHRSKATALGKQVRDQESTIQMLSAEVDALKEELGRARNETTGSDLESRRSRFESDRLRSELDSERMERMRIQRALENREKEIQAMQAQTAGQASSLFLDELHRLVRRLESELDLRTSSAHEALKSLDRLDVSESMVAVVSNLRAALMSAAGLHTGEQDDALKSLNREFTAPAALPRISASRPAVDLISFETCLASYDIAGAVSIARELLRGGETGAGLLMLKVYNCQSLRQAEVGNHLDHLVKLLETLHEVFDAANRDRGSEGPETERFYVQTFDFLHNLVRLKLVTRATGEAWRFFLDIRSRFSFVTSDKQWAEYRDRVLK